MTTSPFALLDTATTQVTYADTVSELVDQLIDGHADSDDAGRLALRADALGAHAGRAQALVLASIGDRVQQLDEDTLTVLLHDRTAVVPEFDEWDVDLPLFLLSTGYAPYTEAAAPVGDQIVWLDPSTERTFLDSLSTLGVAELLVHSGDNTD